MYCIPIAIKKDAYLAGSVFAFIYPYSERNILVQFFLCFNHGHTLMIELNPGNGNYIYFWHLAITPSNKELLQRNLNDFFVSEVQTPRTYWMD